MKTKSCYKRAQNIKKKNKKKPKRIIEVRGRDRKHRKLYQFHKDIWVSSHK